MSIKCIPGFNQAEILSKLREIGADANKLKTIVSIIFTPVIMDLMNELDKQFKSTAGNPAYPRALLLGIYLYAMVKDIHKYCDLTYACKYDNLLRIFTCDESPSQSTLRRFLENTPVEIMKKVFVASLFFLNEDNLLKFTKLFIDGTDALINGSKYFTMKIEELRALKIMHDWGLLHTGKPHSIKKSYNKVLKYRKFYMEQGNDSMVKMTELILSRISLYNRKIYKKYPLFEEVFIRRGKKYICITHPTAVMMKTKKYNNDFGYNLQEVMTENKIAITGILLEKANDKHVLWDVLVEIESIFEMLAEMVKKYGSRRNYKELKNKLWDSILVCDSGYFTDFNLKAADLYNVNILIMPSKLAKQINNEIRQSQGLEIKTGKTRKDGKSGKNDLRFGIDCVYCQNDIRHSMSPIEEVNSRRNMYFPLEQHKINKYSYSCSACDDCPDYDNCANQEVSYTMNSLMHDMYNKLSNKRYRDIYALRYHSSECINGYLKRIDGVLHLMGSTKEACQNEVYMANMAYNLFRRVNLKGCAY